MDSDRKVTGIPGMSSLLCLAKWIAIRGEDASVHHHKKLNKKKRADDPLDI